MLQRAGDKYNSGLFIFARRNITWKEVIKVEWKLGWYHSCDNYRTLPFTFPELTEVIQAVINLSGKAVRLNLSNLYGKTKLVFQKVEVSLDEKFHVKQTATFNGVARAEIVQGTIIMSDPVWLKVSAGMKLYVKLSSCVKQTYSDFCCTYDTTMTNAAFVRNYKGLPHLQRSMTARRGWFCLNEINILTDNMPEIINMTGDSLVEMGQISASVAEVMYRAYPEKVVVVNTGISGGRLLYDAPDDEQLYQTFGLSLLKRASTEAQKINPIWTIAFIGSNDLLMPLLSKEAAGQTVTVETFLQGILQLRRILVERNSRFILGTILPFSLGHGTVPHTSRYIQAVEKRFKINQQLYLLPETIDCSRIVEDENHCLKAEYDFGDHLHLNKRGGQKIAAAICAKISAGD